MKLLFVIWTFSGLIALNYSESSESKLLTKLTPVNNAKGVYADNADTHADLTASASDRTFHITKDYGSVGYPGGYSYGANPGFIGSVYPGTSYRGSNLIPGYRGRIPGYPGGIIGGGHIGYGYYGNTGNYPGYPGYSGYGGYGGGYGGYGDNGIRGYTSGGYGGYGGYGSYGVGGYDDGYLGYGRSGYDRFDGVGGYDSYDYGSGYGSTYAARNPYSPYSYRGGSYGTSIGNPSGYRGYS